MKLSDIEFRAMESWWRRWGQEHSHGKLSDLAQLFHPQQTLDAVDDNGPCNVALSGGTAFLCPAIEARG